MTLTKTQVAIPKYAFEQDPATGNPVFRIKKNDSVVNYRKADFLVPHRKDYYFMAFIKKGGGRHWIDMTSYTIKPNKFYFTIPEQVNLKEQAAQITGVVICFTKDFLALDENHSLRKLPIIENPHHGHELDLNPKDIVFVEDILEKIYLEYNAKGEWQSNMLLAYMEVLLIYLSRLYTEQFSQPKESPDRHLLKKYLLLIEESYSEFHEVAAYADRMNISAGHLSEFIKKQSGKPAIAHIHERLILEAKRLLLHSDDSIKEIAFQLGFEDASYFNKFFKRLALQTPLQFRMAIREIYL
ncbi:MAG TPA: AraC family transcriptional regulator [Chryseolinea sp.]